MHSENEIRISVHAKMRDRKQKHRQDLAKEARSKRKQEQASWGIKDWFWEYANKAKQYYQLENPSVSTTKTFNNLEQKFLDMLIQLEEK